MPKYVRGEMGVSKHKLGFSSEKKLSFSVGFSGFC